MFTTFVFKPLQAHLFCEGEKLQNATTYCKISIGKQKVKGQVAKEGGANPQWIDSIIIASGSERYCKIKIKEKRFLIPDRHIGECWIDLEKVSKMRESSQWFDIYDQQKITGEIFIEINRVLDDANFQVSTLSTSESITDEYFETPKNLYRLVK